jgi:hypothetical protein
MFELEYMAQVEQRYREDVLYPKAARNARHLRDLELQDQASGRLRRGRKPVRWVGRGLVGAGDLLVALGERLAPRAGGLRTANRR